KEQKITTLSDEIKKLTDKQTASEERLKDLETQLKSQRGELSEPKKAVEVRNVLIQTDDDEIKELKKSLEEMKELKERELAIKEREIERLSKALNLQTESEEIKVIPIEKEKPTNTRTTASRTVPGSSSTTTPSLNSSSFAG